MLQAPHKSWLCGVQARLAEAAAKLAYKDGCISALQVDLQAAQDQPTARAAESHREAYASPAELEAALAKVASLEASLQEQADQLAKATKNFNGAPCRAPPAPQGRVQ